MENLRQLPSAALAAAAIVSASVVAWVFSKPRFVPSVHTVGGREAPPGPPRNLFLGNVSNFPFTDWFVHFSAWQKIYGDVIYLEVPGMPVLVLHNLEDVEELLVKRGSVYSHRLDNYMINDLMGFSWSVVAINPGEAHNEMRKVGFDLNAAERETLTHGGQIFRKVLGPRSVTAFDSLLEEESETLRDKLASFSGDPDKTVENAVGGAVIKMAYGKNIYQRHGEELTKLNVDGVEMVTSTFTRLWLPNIVRAARFLPSWTPGLQFPRVVAHGKVLIERIRHWGFAMVKEDMMQGKADLSVVSKYLSEPEFSEEYLRDAVALMYMPASDTTAASILSFLAMLFLHPSVQEQIQNELDMIVGRTRPVKMDDLPKLKYLKAAWTETFRLNPPTPTGVPHCAGQDDVWKGYVIPKKTMIVPNLGFILRDPRIWGEDAEEYRPERFIPELNPRLAELPDASTMSFGVGRRVCPGRYLAERLSVLFSAVILQAYTIVPLDGEKVPESVAYGDDFVRKPTGLRCRFIPRN